MRILRTHRCRDPETIGAGRYERTEERTTHRNGSRSCVLSKKAGDVELHIPSYLVVALGT